MADEEILRKEDVEEAMTLLDLSRTNSIQADTPLQAAATDIVTSSLEEGPRIKHQSAGSETRGPASGLYSRILFDTRAALGRRAHARGQAAIF
ncbi:MAG TPA: hypothetical protein VE641_21345 [Chthoniobacterales bacterium]|nr:hypothetical protein [Chthoniobacterales bacterium]